MVRTTKARQTSTIVARRLQIVDQDVSFFVEQLRVWYRGFVLFGVVVDQRLDVGTDYGVKSQDVGCNVEHFDNHFYGNIHVELENVFLVAYLIKLQT